MPGYTKKDRDHLEEIQARLEALHAEMCEAVDTFNSEAEQLWEETAQPAVTAYEAALEEMAGTLEDMAAAFEEAVEDLPLRLQESGDDNGWAGMAIALRAGAAAFDLGRLGRLEGPDEIEPYEPCDALGRVLMELGQPED